MALNLQAISITSTISAIKNFFSSQENNSRWSTLSEGSEGTSFIRFMANILSSLSYRLVSARRENYISTANLLSSNIGIAVNLGYSVFRGTNQKRIITINPSQTMVVPALSVIGTYNQDYDIINVDELSLVQGVNQDITTVIGKVKTLSFTAGTSDVKLFQQFTEGISEDFLLYKDYTTGSLSNIPLPVTKSIRELSNDYYLVRTNPNNSVDILYLNNNPNGNYKYGTETIFTIIYVELADVPTITYTSEMFLYGTLVNTKIIELYQPFETTDNIKIRAPLYHETQNLIRSKKDFVKNLIEIDSTVISGGYRVITPTLAAVTYLKNDLTTLSDTKTTAMLNTFSEQEFMGTPNPLITAPKQSNLTANITLKLNNQYSSISDINVDVQNILSRYDNILAQTINTYTIERLLEDLSYVKYARVEYSVSTRANNHIYNMGDMITVDGNNYIASDILGLTGSSEPSWNLAPVYTDNGINLGSLTIDNGIVWRTCKRLNVPVIKEWYSGTTHKIGDFVYSNGYINYMFQVVDLIKRSGSTTPDFSNVVLGDFINDGQIVWVCKTLTDVDPLRVNSTIYGLGDSIRVGNYSFECISYRDSSGSSQPSFELHEYIVVSQGTNSLDISGDYIDFFNVDDVLNVYVGEYIYNFSVESVSYSSGSDLTTVTLQQDLNPGFVYEKIIKEDLGTHDGSVYFKLVEDITAVKYDWNSYLNNYIVNLTVK